MARGASSGEVTPEREQLSSTPSELVANMPRSKSRRFIMDVNTAWRGAGSIVAWPRAQFLRPLAHHGARGELTARDPRDVRVNSRRDGLPLRSDLS